MNFPTSATFLLVSALAAAQEPAEPEAFQPAGTEGVAVTAAKAADAVATAAPGHGETSAVTPPGEKVEIGFSELLNRPGGLTSDEAAKAATNYSLDAKIAEQDLKAAEAQVTKTKYNYAPRVTLSASYTRRSIPDLGPAFGEANLVGTTEPTGPIGAGAPLFAVDGSAFAFTNLANNYSMNAGLVIPISDYLLNMSQAFAGVNAAKRSAELNREAAQLNAAANARLMYYEWALAKLRTAEAERTIARAEAQLKELKLLHQAGQVARADVLRQDAFLARTELDLRRARVRADVAQQDLHAIMSGGQGKLPAWQIGEDILRQQPGDKVTGLDMERLQNEAISNRLEIQALENTVYAFTQKSTVERTQGYPRVEGFGDLTYANPNQNYFPIANEWNASWDLGVRLVWTLNDLGSSAAVARTTDAETAQVRAQKQQLADRLRTEVLTATSTMEEADLGQKSAERGLVAAQAAYDDRAQLFRHGRATSLDLLESESALLRSRLDLIESYVALRMARVRFEHALGRDVPK
jgi:outer membrane protein